MYSTIYHHKMFFEYVYGKMLVSIEMSHNRLVYVQTNQWHKQEISLWVFESGLYRSISVGMYHWSDFEHVSWSDSFSVFRRYYYYQSIFSAIERTNYLFNGLLNRKAKTTKKKEINFHRIVNKQENTYQRDIFVVTSL